MALAGGITTFHVLPGSANLFGGKGVTLKNVSANTVPEMKFPDAPHSLKMACGENPKGSIVQEDLRQEWAMLLAIEMLGLVQKL